MNKYSRQLISDKYSQIHFFKNAADAINEFPELQTFLNSPYIEEDKMIAILDENSYEFWKPFIQDTEINTKYSLGNVYINVRSNGFWGGCWTVNKYHIFCMRIPDYANFIRFIDCLMWEGNKIKFDDLFCKNNDSEE